MYFFTNIFASLIYCTYLCIITLTLTIMTYEIFEKHLAERVEALKARKGVPTPPDGFKEWLSGRMQESKIKTNQKRVKGLAECDRRISLNQKTVLSEVEILQVSASEWVVISSSAYWTGRVPSGPEIIGRFGFPVRKMVTRRGSSEFHSIGKLVWDSILTRE